MDAGTTRQGQPRGRAPVRAAGRAALSFALAASLSACALSRHIVYAPLDRPVAIRAEPAGQPQPVSVTTSDGLTLGGYYWPGRPNDPDIAVYFHGRHWNAEKSANSARYLAAGGHAVLVASYRGFGGNPGSPTQKGLLRDASAFIAKARDLRGPHARIWLVGHSIGGAVALHAAAQEPGISGVIALSSFVRIAEAAPRIARGLIPDRWDNRAALAALHIPVLFVQGALDRYLPAGSAETLLAEYAGPAALIVGEHSRHNPDMAQIGPWLIRAMAAMTAGSVDTLPPLPPGWIETARKP